jgi:glycosyltransferase involved in cell wall biosynthesis
MVTSIRRAERASGHWQESIVDGIHVHAIPVPYSNTMPYYDRIRAFMRFAFHAALRASRLGADLVFATSTPLTIALPAVYAGWRSKAPMVLEVRDLWPELPIAIGAVRGPVSIGASRWLERFAYRHAARIIALSPGMRDGIAAAGYPMDRIEVIPNAADLDLFSVARETGQAYRTRLPGGDKAVVTYAGTLGRINGVGYLAHIAARSKEKGLAITFLVVGRGAERDAIASLAERLGVLGDNFHMLEPIPKAEMPYLLSATDLALSLFVDLPEMWNNSANKFFDALASGTPVAINYQGWQADLIRETGAGVVLPASDPDGAAEMLIDLISDVPRLEAAGSAALHLAESRFNRDLLFVRFENALVAAAQEARPR